MKNVVSKTFMKAAAIVLACLLFLCSFDFTALATEEIATVNAGEETPTALELYYTGTNQTLIGNIQTYNDSWPILGGSTERYGYSLDAENWYYNSNVSSKIVGNEVDTYTVYYRKETRTKKSNTSWNSWGDFENYDPITVSIAPADLVEIALTIDGNPGSTVSYDGELHTPAVAQVTAVDKVLAPDEYIVTDDTAQSEADNYTITVIPVSPNYNQGTAVWSIQKKELYVTPDETAQISYPYSGSTQIPDYTVTNEAGEELSAGHDYSISYFVSGIQVAPEDFAPTNVGSYSMSFTGLGEFQGSNKSFSWTIVKATPEIKGVENLVYNGNTFTLVTVSEGCDFHFNTLRSLLKDDKTIPTETNAGKYTIYYYISGNDNYSGVGSYLSPKSVTVEIAKATTDVHIEQVGDLVYNGEEQSLVVDAPCITTEGIPADKLLFRVNTPDGEGEWTSDASVLKVKNAGYYSVGYKVEANNNWTAVSGAFSVTINKKEITPDMISVKNLPYSGKEQNADISMYLGTTLLEAGEDYTISGDLSATEAGEYTVTITGVNNFCGEQTITWKIINFKAALNKTEFTYDGSKKEVCLSVTKTDGTTPLIEGTDYEVSYASIWYATNAGKYSVILTGLGEYEEVGEISLTWIINPEQLSKSDLSLDKDSLVYIYDGKEKSVTPEVKHYFGLKKKELEKDVDYEVTQDSVLTAVDAGTYNVTIKGIGNYCGEVTKDWTIVGVPIDTLLVNVTLTEKEYTYDGEEKTPEIKVATVGGLVPLTEGEDYVIADGSELSGINAGEYTITIKGQGKYSGEKKVTWKINPAPVEVDWIYYKDRVLILDLPVKLDGESFDVTGSGSAGPGSAEKIEVRKSALGGTLTEGVDYKLSEDNVYEAVVVGGYPVTIEGLGNYCGTATATWYIGSGVDDYVAEVKIDGDTNLLHTVIYNGEVRKVEVKLRDSLLREIDPENYTIDESSVFEAKDAGTYTITINGNPEKGYVGTKTITWIITQKPLISAKWDRTTAEYNGEVQRPVLTLDGIVEADKDKCYISEAKAISITKPKHAGKYTMFASLEGTDDFNADNYSFLLTGGVKVLGKYRWTTEFEITKREVGVSWTPSNPASYEYDGLSHRPTAHATNTVKGDTVLLKQEGERGVKVGKYTTSVTGMTFDASLLFDDYVLTEDENMLVCEYEITPRDMSRVTVIPHIADSTYTGNPQSPKVRVFELLAELKEGEDFEVEEISETDAGTYDVTIKGLGRYGGTTTGKWTINKACPEYSIAPIKGVTYNTKDQEIVKGEFLGHSLGCKFEYNVEGKTGWKDTAEAKNAGSYTVYYRIIGDKNHYDVEGCLKHFCIGKIAKAEISAKNVSFEQDTFVYDGTEKSPKVIVTLDDGTIVPESDYHICEKSPASDLKAKDAGTYDTYVTTKSDCSNNLTQKGSEILLNWKIEPKTVAVSGKIALDKVYDGTTSVQLDKARASIDNVLIEKVALLSASGSSQKLLAAEITPNQGICGDDDVSVSLKGAKAEFEDKNAGKDKTVYIKGISLAGAQAGNYKLLSHDIEVKADIDPLEITVTADDKEKFEGYLDPQLSYTAKTLAKGDSLEGVSMARDKGEKPGTYEINIKVDAEKNPNYSIKTVKGRFLIKALGPQPKPDPSDPTGGGNSPQTGDNSKLIIWLIGMIVSAISIAVAALLLRKRRANVHNMGA